MAVDHCLSSLTHKQPTIIFKLIDFELRRVCLPFMQVNHVFVPIIETQFP